MVKWYDIFTYQPTHTNQRNSCRPANIPAYFAPWIWIGALASGLWISNTKIEVINVGSGHLIAILAHFMQPSNWTVREPNWNLVKSIYFYPFFVGKLGWNCTCFFMELWAPTNQRPILWGDGPIWRKNRSFSFMGWRKNHINHLKTRPRLLEGCWKEGRFPPFHGKFQVDYTPEVQQLRPWKMVAGRLLSNWEAKFSGAMLNFQGVLITNFFRFGKKDP